MLALKALKSQDIAVLKGFEEVLFEQMHRHTSFTVKDMLTHKLGNCGD